MLALVNASMGILAQLGDMLHTDSMVPATPTSGHILDQDTRYQNIVRNVIHTLRCIVDMMLKKHDTVHVIQGEGNHDISSSVWLREMFASFYENEPRVTVDTNPLPYYAYQFGDVMLAFHHGHLRKPKDLASVFAAQYPQMWGKTSHRYAHCGHLHHKVEVENAGMTVTQHRTRPLKTAMRLGWLPSLEQRSAARIAVNTERSARRQSRRV